MAAKIIIALIILLLGGCAPLPQTYQYIERCSTSLDLNNLPGVREKLQAQYNAWKGTPYRAGGLSKNGIDCSGFVYLTYRSLLCIDLPRSTDGQAAIGRDVAKTNLRPGDLVFFKTGFMTRHVGIYVDRDMFVHASTRKGVTLSSLNDIYWGPRYWKARRL